MRLYPAGNPLFAMKSALCLTSFYGILFCSLSMI